MPKNERKIKIKQPQDEEGFYLLICHFDFLCLIFDIVRNLELQLGDCFGMLCLAMTTND